MYNYTASVININMTSFLGYTMIKPTIYFNSNMCIVEHIINIITK